MKHKKKKKSKENGRHTYLRGASGIVNGARNEDSPLAIDEKRLFIIGDITVYQLRTDKQEREKQSE